MLKTQQCRPGEGQELTDPKGYVCKSIKSVRVCEGHGKRDQARGEKE